MSIASTHQTQRPHQQTKNIHDHNSSFKQVNPSVGNMPSNPFTNTPSEIKKEASINTVSTNLSQQVGSAAVLSNTGGLTNSGATGVANLGGSASANLKRASLNLVNSNASQASQPQISAKNPSHPAPDLAVLNSTIPSLVPSVPPLTTSANPSKPNYQALKNIDKMTEKSFSEHITNKSSDKELFNKDDYNLMKKFLNLSEDISEMSTTKEDLTQTNSGNLASPTEFNNLIETVMESSQNASPDPLVMPKNLTSLSNLEHVMEKEPASPVLTQISSVQSNLCQIGDNLAENSGPHQQFQMNSVESAPVLQEEIVKIVKVPEASKKFSDKPPKPPVNSEYSSKTLPKPSNFNKNSQVSHPHSNNFQNLSLQQQQQNSQQSQPQLQSNNLSLNQSSHYLQPGVNTLDLTTRSSSIENAAQIFADIETHVELLANLNVSKSSLLHPRDWKKE